MPFFIVEYALIAFVLFMIFNALAGGFRPAQAAKAARRARRRGRSRDLAPLVVAGVLLFAMMNIFGLDWLAHPVAGLGLAWYASLVFRRRLPLQRIALALGLLGLAAVSGAHWVVYPLGGLTLAWFATLLFRGPTAFSSSWTSVRPELTSGSAAPLPDLDDVRERVRPARRERRRDRREREEVAVSAAPPPPIGEDYATPLDQLLNAHLARLPEEARVRLADLGRRVRAVQGDLERRGELGGETRFLLRQTATDYAPGAVNAYLRLPPSVANVTPLADGKTGKDLLIGQLDLLLSAVEAASTDVAQSAGQDLLAHGRFLEDKFGKKDFDI